MSQQSNLTFFVKSTLTIASGTGATFNISNDNELDAPITFTTNTSIVLKNDTQLERMIITATGGVATIVLRGLTQADSETESSGLKKQWADGASGYMSPLAFDLVDKGTINTFKGTQTIDNGNLNITNDTFGVIWDTDFYVKRGGNDMLFRDKSNTEISLSTISAAAGADTKVAISTNDTTPSQLEDKLIESDGITLTKNNPAGNENFNIKVNVADATIHATETSKGLVERATHAEALNGTDTTKYVAPADLGIDIEPLFTTITHSNITNDTTSNSSTFTFNTKTVGDITGETASNISDSGTRSNSLQVEISSVWTSIKTTSAGSADDIIDKFIYTFKPNTNYRISITNTSSSGITSNSLTIKYQAVN